MTNESVVLAVLKDEFDRTHNSETLDKIFAIQNQEDGYEEIVEEVTLKLCLFLLKRGNTNDQKTVNWRDAL